MNWLRAVFREMARPREGENHKVARGRAADVLRLTDRQARSLLYPEPNTNYSVALDPEAVEEAWTRYLREERDRAAARVVWAERHLAEAEAMVARRKAAQDAVARDARIAKVERDLRGIADERVALFERRDSGAGDGVQGVGDGAVGARGGLGDDGGGDVVPACRASASSSCGPPSRAAGPARSAASGRR
jgi:hypothetical protein